MRIPWQVNSVAAAACIGIGLGDLAMHEWWGIGPAGASAALNVWISHRNYNRQHQAASRRPDYAKIRRLELELGLRDPDPVVDAGSPFLSHAPPARRDIYQTPPPPPPPPLPMTPPSQRDDLPPGIVRGTMNEYLWRQQRDAAGQWATCPVCLRRHAGRCAG